MTDAELLRRLSAYSTIPAPHQIAKDCGVVPSTITRHLQALSIEEAVVYRVERKGSRVISTHIELTPYGREYAQDRPKNVIVRRTPKKRKPYQKPRRWFGDTKSPLTLDERIREIASRGTTLAPSA